MRKNGHGAGNSRRINIALQGGGAHGAFAWGVLDRLLEDGRLDIAGLSATSAGAMNAVVYAHGRCTGGTDGARETLERFWRAISRAGETYSPSRRTPLDDWLSHFGIKEPIAFHVFEATTRLFSPYQLNPYNVNPLRDILEEIVDFERLQGSNAVDINLSATNVRTGSIRVFRNPEITSDAVLASACLPMLFHAVEIDGQHYWDGGYMGNPAIFPLIYNTDVRDILILHINPIVRPDLPTTPPEIFNRINEISFNSSLIRELRAISFVTKLIDEDWLKDEHKSKLKRILVHAIRTDQFMCAYSVASKFETDWPFLIRLRDAGRAAAEEWLERCWDQVGVSSTVDIQRDYLN